VWVLMLALILSISFVLADGGVININGAGDYSSIQDAVNNATAGDTINVGAGTYNENQIVIDKPIKLIGAGADTTIINGETAALLTTGLIRINSNGDVTVKGFAIKNAGGVDNGNDNGDDKTNVGIYTESSSDSSTYTITENKIYGTNNADDEEDYGFYSHSGKEQLIFTKNTIREVSGNSILLEKHTGGVDISDNDLDAGVYGIDSIFAMTYGEVDITSLQKITNNHFDMSSGTYDHGATAISFASSYNEATLGGGKFTNIKVINNTIENLKQNRRGIGLWNGDSTNGNSGEITAEIFNNKIKGENADKSRGISLLGKTNNVKIINNTVENLWRGMWLTDSVTGGMHYPLDTEINKNNFLNNDFGLVWDGADLLNAESNYWNKCGGPSGNDVTGNVDYTPWIGVCVKEKTQLPSCILSSDNIALYANTSSTFCAGNVIFSVLKDGVWNNFTGSSVGSGNPGNYVHSLSSSFISGGQSFDWTVYAYDCMGHVSNSGIQTFYVNNKTIVNVDPVLPNGLNPWYITEPLFSLVNNDASIISYRWNGNEIKTYTSAFGLENAPNNANITGGIHVLKYRANLCGKTESWQNTTFKFDFKNPVIKNEIPQNGSTIYETKPIISAYLDEIYQSNSGIDEQSIIMTLDGNDVSNEVDVVPFGLDAVVSYTSLVNLSDGWHNVTINVRDKSGRSSERTWTFYVDLTNFSPFNLIINSPKLDDMYGTKRVLLNLTTSKRVKEISYIDLNKKNPRWRRLCRNCKEYGNLNKKTLNAKEGWNNITIKATDTFGNTQESNLVFFVDSKAPSISKMFPKKNSVVNGSEFSLTYTEDNLKEIKLFFNPNITLENCTSGKNQECKTSADLTQFENSYIGFYFEISDGINKVKTKETRVFVDTISPVLNLNLPENITYKRKVPFNINVSEKVTIEYLDDKEQNPRWRRLCNNCDEYGNEKLKLKSFKPGIHHVFARGTDDAGNSDIKDVWFEVKL